MKRLKIHVASIFFFQHPRARNFMTRAGKYSLLKYSQFCPYQAHAYLTRSNCQIRDILFLALTTTTKKGLASPTGQKLTHCDRNSCRQPTPFLYRIKIAMLTEMTGRHASTQKIILVTQQSSGRQARINPPTVIKICLVVHLPCCCVIHVTLYLIGHCRYIIIQPNLIVRPRGHKQKK